MSQRFLTSIDFTKKAVINLVLEKLVSAPASPVLAQFYYNSTNNTPEIYNGSAWIPLDPSKLTDGYIPLSKLASNPLARANHTGTQLSTTISDLTSTVKSYRLDEFVVPSVDLNINNKRLTNVALGVAATDAVNYQQVLDMIAGVTSRKSAVRVYSANSLTLSGLQTIDGVSLAAGDRVGAGGNGTAAGIYVAASGAWPLASDSNSSEEVTPGMQFFVSEGTVNGNTTWQLITDGPIVLGTTSLTFAQTGQATVYAGSSTINIDVNKNISAILGVGLVSSSGIAIDTSIVSTKKVFVIGDGSAVSFVLTHNFGSRSFTSEIYESATPYNKVMVDVQHTSTSQATIVFDGTYVPTSGEFTVILVS